MIKRIVAVVMLGGMLILSGCVAKEEPVKEAMVKFKMDAEMAKKIMDSGEPHIILDVRTAEEFASGHIENAYNLPVEELEARKSELPQDRAMTILVYCRSGNRSSAAADKLLEFGYTQVIDFGGIIDWPYEVVK